MRSLFLCAALTLLSSAESRGDDTGATLFVQFEPAIAKVALRSNSRPVQLPRLTFAVRVEASCPATLEAQSISLSIADTRIRLQPDESGVVDKTISVPQKQLGPIAVNDFCMAGDDTDSEQQISLKDALSAQLSLRCSGENQESIQYETAALEVILQCEIPENTQAL